MNTSKDKIDYKNLIIYCDKGEDKSVLKYLKKYNIDGIACDEEILNNSLPINIAIDANNLSTVKLLIDFGANLDKFVNTCYGYITPIYVSVFSSIELYNQGFFEIPQIDMIKILAENNANLNVINNDNKTPLDICIELGHFTGYKYLREKGAKTSKELEDKSN